MSAVLFKASRNCWHSQALKFKIFVETYLEIQMEELYSHIFSYACFTDLHHLHIIALQGTQEYDCPEFACCVNVFSEVQTVENIETYVILYCCNLLFLSVTIATNPYSCMSNHRIISRKLRHWIGTNLTNYPFRSQFQESHYFFFF